MVAALVPYSSAVTVGRVIEVSAPSRLHFGLFSFGHPTARQFGGVGVMIDRPAVGLRISPAAELETAGPLADRAREFALRWAAFYGLAGAPPCRIVVGAVPPPHAGLGVGTQLGLSIAAGLTAACGFPMPPPAELAQSVGRGLRSAVGTYGFALGGLVVERGKLPGERISPLDIRMDLPPAWRFVLVLPDSAAGLSGQEEREAFARLPPVPPAVTAQLLAEVRTRMLPAAARQDFAAFSDSLYAYGRLAGQCFASIQGGPFHGPRLSGLVALIRSLGVTGVGQSSWGPTLFAVLPDDAHAEEFVGRLSAHAAADRLQLAITAPSSHGARIRRLPDTRS